MVTYYIGADVHCNSTNLSGFCGCRNVGSYPDKRPTFGRYGPVWGGIDGGRGMAYGWEKKE